MVGSSLMAARLRKKEAGLCGCARCPGTSVLLRAIKLVARGASHVGVTLIGAGEARRPEYYANSSRRANLAELN